MVKKEMIAMLLAGGQGSRLGVLTSKVAKPAVKKAAAKAARKNIYILTLGSTIRCTFLFKAFPSCGIRCTFISCHYSKLGGH